MTANQLRAAKPEASVWVSASAGTGKTKVLTDRVLNLLLAGTAPERILCLTFTKAAAAEMSERIARTLGTWATMADGALKKDLNRLSGQVPEAEVMRSARQLFAAVLDVPGGMKIMTIHAFCQSLLKRFPLEAGLAPHFVVMDERDAAELMDEARKELLVQVQREGGDLAAALDRVTLHVGEDGFSAVMREMAMERARLRRLLTGGDAVERALRDRLGLGPDDTSETISTAACADVAFDAMGLRLAAGAMVQGSKTDQAHGQIIAEWLAAASAERADRLAGYLSAFFTDGGKGDRRAHLVHKDAAALDPHAETVLAAEAERLAQIRERLRAATTFAATAAVLRLGGAWLDIYERHKADRALLDYDDLILLSRDLLRGDGAAAWVLYKLDGGIDHILIDEAQDTNPEQWDIVRALAEEFFAGEGARETPRTIFAVGDPKQSIYSFQRAAPEEFERMRAYFSARVRACAARWDDVPLEDSFRSTAAVLKLVDAVFARAPARDGVVTGDRPLRHLVHRIGQAGRVELWPLAPTGDKQQTEDWAPPVAQIAVQSPRARLAAFIAARIQGWIETGERLESAGRPIRAGDIIVLLPRRGAFVEELVWALKQRGVPVAGVDRMVLTEQLPVMDLMALGRFLLMPEDDLTLATLLKSPICGLSEDQLFGLAHGRSGSLWQALLQKRGDGPEFERVAGELGTLLAKADFVPPYELYADLLGAGSGRRRLLARLGHEADDPIDEFLSLCLAYERVHTPSLQGFLHWFEAGQTAIKRDLEQASRDEVRVMTVHGAKGLEAPIVFLPDTLQTPSRLAGSRSALLWPDGDGILLWPPRKEHEEAVATAARADALERQYREHRRLLYVALTRAAERLYICGWEGHQKMPEDCWYNLVAGAMTEIAAPVEDILADRPLGWPGQGRRLDVAQTVPVETSEVLGTPAESAPPPDWLRAPAPPEPTPPRPLAPSRPSASEPSVRSPVQGVDGQPDDGVRFRRGLLIHRLLQVLPETRPEDRAVLCNRYLAMADRALDEAARREIAQEVLAVLDDPRMQPFYGPDTRAEVPLSGVIADQIVSGQVDRLLVTADAVHVLDYKSNRPPPDREQDVSPAYLKQMAAYRALLRGIYPDRPVSCALLWTDGPRLMPLSDAVLDSHVP